MGACENLWASSTCSHSTAPGQPASTEALTAAPVWIHLKGTLTLTEEHQRERQAEAESGLVMRKMHHGFGAGHEERATVEGRELSTQLNLLFLLLAGLMSGYDLLCDQLHFNPAGDQCSKQTWLSADKNCGCTRLSEVRSVVYNNESFFFCLLQLDSGRSLLL